MFGCNSKRSAKKEHYPLVWNIIAGWLPEDIDPAKHILTEVKEELSVSGKILLGPIRWQFFRPERNLVITDATFLIELDAPGDIQIDREHSAYEWIGISEINQYETFDNIKENLHQLGATEQQTPFKVLYTNYKGDTKWRYILPRMYYFGETEYHQGKRWLLECFDLGKNAVRTYAVEDIAVMVPPIFQEDAWAA